MRRSLRVASVALLCQAACREPPRELTLEVHADSRMVTGAPGGKEVERVEIVVRTEPRAAVRVLDPKAPPKIADAAGIVKATVDLSELHGKPDVWVSVAAADNPSRVVERRVTVARVAGMRREGRGWAVFPRGCRWELDRFTLLATACEPGTVIEVAGKRITADGPDARLPLDRDAMIAELPASLERISTSRTLAVALTTPAGKRYEGAWEMAAFEAEARARLRAAEAGAVVFGAADVADKRPRAAYFFARGRNTPRLLGRAATVKQVDLVAFERDAGAKPLACPRASGERPREVHDANVEVFDRRKGKRLIQKRFSPKVTCADASTEPAFVPDATMHAWVSTLLE